MTPTLRRSAWPPDQLAGQGYLRIDLYGPKVGLWVGWSRGQGGVGHALHRGWHALQKRPKRSAVTCVSGSKWALGGRFSKMGFLAKNGQNGPAAELYGGRGPMTYLDPRFPVPELSKFRAWSGQGAAQAASRHRSRRGQPGDLAQRCRR